MFVDQCFLAIKRVKKTRFSEKDQKAIDSTTVSPFRCSYEVSTDAIKVAIMYFTNSMGLTDPYLR